MAEFRLSAPAEAQLMEILDWSEEHFGEVSRARYASLLVKAMENVADDPHHTSVAWKRFTSGPVGVYHVRHSRDRVPDPPGSVREPRHYLIFRLGHEGIVDILGFIHERMLFDRALRRLLRVNQDSR
jgi:toxin ParE1/3/4